MDPIDRKELSINEKTFENKSKFIASLEKTLAIDNRSNVEDIVLRYNQAREEEIITVFFRGGGKKEILATYNSNYANAKEILKAVYE